MQMADKNMVYAVRLDLIPLHLHLCGFATIDEIQCVVKGKNLRSGIPLVCRGCRTAAQDEHFKGHTTIQSLFRDNHATGHLLRTESNGVEVHACLQIAAA